MTLPTRADWDIYRGDTVTRYWPVFDEDGAAIASATDFTARVEIRDPDDGTVLESWDPATVDVGGDPSTVRVATPISAADSAAITWRTAVYDVEVTTPTDVVRTLYSGIVRVHGDVTRSTN